MNKDSLKEFFRSKVFAGILAGVGITLIAVFLFEAGVTVGYHEATFSERWGANYGKNFGVSNDAMHGALPDGNLPTPDGTLGKILSISPASGTSTMIIASAQKPEQKVLIDADTIIRSHEDTLTAASLTVGESVVVLGTPDEQGEIEAKLVRVVGDMAHMGAATSSQE
jgi:hypothetical protein